MNKMIAPILSFTAEEIWSKIPEASKDAESILLSSWYENNDQYIDEELAAKWDQIIKIRKEANKSLERARQGENRIIGNSLDAKILIKLNDEGLAKLLEENRKLIEEVLIVSSLEIVSEIDETFTEGEEAEGMFVKVLHAEGEKCERCWKYSTKIGTLEEHPTICPRCSEVLSK
jgi:isoleucyl-tRNA synthetase